MKVGLAKYFKKNLTKNTELIGLQVVNRDDEKFFINDFDSFLFDEAMPRSLFVTKKKDSEFGWYIDSDDLYVEIEEEK